MAHEKEELQVIEMYNEALREESVISGALSQEYSSLFKIDARTGKMSLYRTDGTGMNPKIIEQLLSVDDYDIVLSRYIDRFVVLEDRTRLRESGKLSILMERVPDSGSYKLGYRRNMNGVISYFEMNVVKTIGSMGEVTFILGLRDVDDLVKKEKQQEEELRAALEDAEKANRAKTDFLSRMSHDIRTPLNGILGLLEMDERHPDDKKLIEENREKIKVAANHLNSLLNDILQLSKLESGNVELSREVFDLNVLATDVLTIAAIEASERGIAFYHGDCSGNLIAPFVYGSPLHLRQIFLNIFSNAIKYNKPGGSISCKAECNSIDGKTVTYSCSISDTGIGMSKEFVEHIFEPFTQERSDARSTYQGTGLGMAIVKSLVDKMGGSIRIESVEGEGSTFVITIPFEIADVSGDDMNEPEKRAVTIQNLRILLVEDNELNMEIAQCMLEDAGAVVTKAFHGKEAVDIFRQNPPGTFDAILMDVMMPVMNGIEATKEIRLMERSDTQSIPIIAMTANAFEEDKQATRQAGMNEHLSKPLNCKEVIRVISRHIRV